MRIRAQRLPIGYRELEYLESIDGNQLIKIGSSSAKGYYVKCSFSQLGSERYTLQGYSSTWFGTPSGSNYFQYADGNTTVTTTTILTENTIYEINLDSSGITLNGTLFAYDQSKSKTWNKFGLFQIEDYSQFKFKGKVYASKVFNENNIVIKNLIPAERCSDNKPGMYDLVNNTFYVNSGTSEFIKGPYKNDSYNISLYPRLPLAYQEVEYIESPGGSNYFDSDILFEDDYTEVDLKYYNSTFQFGACNMSGSTRYTLAMYGDTRCYIGRGGTSGMITYPGNGPNIPNPHTLHIKSTNGITKYVIDGVENTKAYPGVANGAPERSPLIFGRWESGYTKAYSTAGCRLYYCKIYKSIGIVRDFVPCYRKSDNVVGLYDLVSNSFFENQGTGTFTKGNNVTSILKCRVRDESEEE